MTAEPRPLLAFGPPAIVARPKSKNRVMPQVSTPGARRQGERLAPQFAELRAAFDAERARLTADSPDEVDPALVVVFDLAGSVSDFRKAIDNIDGLEFLSELIGEQSDPDDDFHMVELDGGSKDKPVDHSLYLVMSNVTAIDQIIKLFEAWRRDPKARFARGLGKLKAAFGQLTAIRRWGPEDRIRETGLRDEWEKWVEELGDMQSSVIVEVELWYRSDADERAAAEAHVERVIADSGGRVIDRSQIAAINYHAVLAELPEQQVHSLLTNGAGSVQLLATDQVMLVSPFAPMSVAAPSQDIGVALEQTTSAGPSSDAPRIALLDGLPFENHDRLAKWLIIDDPDAVGEHYPASARHHGTAMASLIIHGDLSVVDEPIDRPLYVRPIMRPPDFGQGEEQALPDRLFPDLLHRAIRRIVEGDDGRGAAAPSVRIVSLSIGASTRALVSRMSPAGRLLDWLARTYNLLFIVSAGNHHGPITTPAKESSDPESVRSAAMRAVHGRARPRGIYPPGDALNALTVGATHTDGGGEYEVPDTVWDITHKDGPAYYSATGPGVGRSVKPDVHHTGGRAFYSRPIEIPDSRGTVTVNVAPTMAAGPGVKVAAPGRAGATDNAIYGSGTSHATALVTREASRLFDVLEAGTDDLEDTPLPGKQYHPLLVRALLAHASSWGVWEESFRRELQLESRQARRTLTALLGYGRLDTERLGAGAANRAVLVGGGTIGPDERHTHELPLPPSLRARAEWHRVTITLAYMAPTVSHLNRYRGTKVYFDTPDKGLAGGKRIGAEHNAVRRGSLQHEIIEGNSAMVFGDGESFPIHVDCMNDAQRLGADAHVRYALVTSIETAEQTSTTIHDEVRAGLRQRARSRARSRLQP